MSRSLTEVIKDNPMIFVSVLFLIIFALVLFYFEIPDEDHYDENTISHNVPLGGGFGIGPELEKGERIEVEYEVLDGEPIDVYLYRQNFSSKEIRPYNEKEIIHKENTYSGFFSYEAEEHGMYMVFFEGPNYTVHYTIDVIEPGPTIEDANLVLDLFGVFLLLLIIPVLWLHFKMRNPRYIINNLQILPILIIAIGVFVFISNGMVQRNDPDEVLFYVTLLMGLIAYFGIVPIMGHYRLVNRENTNAVAEMIKKYLDGKNINYFSEDNVREYLLKWDHRFVLTDDELSIKLMRQKYQQWQTAVFIGRQGSENKEDLKAFVNELAQELKVDNFRPI